jgi:hypothetical protein
MAGVRFAAKERALFVLDSVQTCPGAHSAPYLMGTGALFLGREADYPRSSTEVKNATVIPPFPNTPSRHVAYLSVKATLPLLPLNIRS